MHEMSSVCETATRKPWYGGISEEMLCAQFFVFAGKTGGIHSSEWKNQPNFFHCIIQKLEPVVLWCKTQVLFTSILTFKRHKNCCWSQLMKQDASILVQAFTDVDISTVIVVLESIVLAGLSLSFLLGYLPLGVYVWVCVGVVVFTLLSAPPPVSPPSPRRTPAAGHYCDQFRLKQTLSHHQIISSAQVCSQPPSRLESLGIVVK